MLKLCNIGAVYCASKVGYDDIDVFIKWPARQDESNAVKGAGGSEVDFHVFIVSDREECQLPWTFFGMKIYWSLPKLSQL